MGFMASYKRLDNLCKDMNQIGVSGYISDMEDLGTEILSVPEWKDDYYKLKHYRYIRNQIAHENDADEETLCSSEDIKWVEDFHAKIMTQNDPLALHYKKTISNRNNLANDYSKEYYVTPKSSSKGKFSNGLIPSLIFLGIILLAVIYYYFIR